MLYFESENELKFYNLEAWNIGRKCKNVDILYNDGERNDNHFGENCMKKFLSVHKFLCNYLTLCHFPYLIYLSLFSLDI